MLSVTSLTLLINVHGATFYNLLGMETSFIAFFTAVARSVDVVTDPVMGYISDNTRTRCGGRKPFMAIGCLGYAFFFIMLFMPPHWADINVIIAWYGVSSILCEFTSYGAHMNVQCFSDFSSTPLF